METPAAPAADRPADGRSGRPADRPAVLLATADPLLHAEVQRLAASVGVGIVPVPDDGGLLRRWQTAPLVLLGADRLRATADLRPPRRPGVVLVSSGPVDQALLRPALDLGVGEVAELPSAGAWLATALADLEHATADGRVVGVLGGAGGAGATTFAAALGQVASRHDATLVVDADAWGPGVDRVLGLEHVDGVGWEQLAGSHGRLAARDLREGVPRRGRLGVLTWRQAAVPHLPGAEQVAEVLAAARRGHDVVVVDLPRLGDSRDQLAAHCDLVVAIVPATVAGVASSIRAVARLEDPTRAGLVLRGRGTDELAAQRATGLPVLATMVSQRGMDEAVDLGLGPVRSFRGPLGRAAGDVLDRLRLAGRAAA